MSEHKNLILQNLILRCVVHEATSRAVTIAAYWDVDDAVNDAVSRAVFDAVQVT